MSNSEHLIPGYTIRSEQGAGTFGTVFRAYWGQELDCAVKVLNTKAIHPQYVSWCLERLRALEGHPRIVQVYGYDLAHEPAYLSTPWAGRMDGSVGTLADVAGKWSAGSVWACLKAVASGLAWLHQNNIIHTGLTSRNVLLLSKDPEDVLITDVGQGCVEGSQVADWSRHAAYLSPERCRQEPPQGESTGEAWDVFAFGVLGFFLLTGRYPRATTYLKSLEKQTRKGEAFDGPGLARLLEREVQVGWGGRAGSASELEMRRVLERCLSLDLGQRYPHMTEVLEGLSAFSFAGVRDIAVEPTSRVDLPAEASEAPKSKTSKTERKTKRVKGRTSSVPALTTPPAPERPVALPIALEAELQPALAPATGLPKLEKPDKSAKGRKEPKVAKAPKEPRSVRPSTSGHPWWQWAAFGSGAAALIALVFAARNGSEASRLGSELKSALAEAESARSEAETSRRTATEKETLAKESTARQQAERANLQKTQEVVDRLVQTLIDQKPADETRIEQWRDSLSSMATFGREFLDKNQKDPALREACARTRWHLAGIRLALGETDAAQTLFEEAARDVDAVAAASAGSPETAEWTLLLGRIQYHRGEIAFSKGKQAEAAQHLSLAAKALEMWVAAHPEDLVALRELAHSAYLEGQALAEKGDVPAALTKFNRAAELLQAMAVNPAKRDEDFFVLADVGFHTFRAQLQQTKDRDKVIAEVEKFAMGTMSKLIEFDREHPKSNDCRERLAQGYTAMARALISQGTTKEASEAYKEAVTVLLELVIANPAHEGYAFQLGQNYGEVSRLVRDAKGPQEALEYSKSAVSFLRKLAEKNRIEPQYRLHLGLELVTMAEMLEDTSQYAEALKTAQNSASLLEEFVAESGVSQSDRAYALSGLARAYGALGHSSEKVTKKDDAITAYSKAVESWQKFVAGGGADEKAQKSLAWTQEQLKRLRP